MGKNPFKSAYVGHHVKKSGEGEAFVLFEGFKTLFRVFYVVFFTTRCKTT